MDLKDKIRSIEDYPQKGVIFRDITTLLKDAEGLKDAVDAITASLADVSFDLVLSPESRGFIFGMPVAPRRPRLRTTRRAHRGSPRGRTAL